jgi:hypothetical protein
VNAQWETDSADSRAKRPLRLVSRPDLAERSTCFIRERAPELKPEKLSSERAEKIGQDEPAGATNWAGIS